MRDQHILDIAEAYSSIYEQSILDTVVDTATSAVKPPVQRQANKKYGPLGGYVAGREVDKIGNQVKSGDYGGALNRAVQGAGKLFNSVDMFDIVKGHLLDEGYADTEEAALAIMANMSEEWKQSIVEEVFDEALTGERYKKAVKNPGGTAYSRMVSADPSKRATRGGRGGESDFGAGDRGSGNKAARRAGTYKED